MSERDLFEAYIENQLGAKPETWKAAVIKYGCYPVAPAIEDNYFSRSTQDRWETWQAARATPAAAAEVSEWTRPRLQLERFGYATSDAVRPSRMDDGYWTPWHIAQVAIDIAASTPPRHPGSSGRAER